jgi:glycosyltransferase involved in cell wall biosynthesis
MGANYPEKPKQKPLRLLYVDTETFWRGGQEQLLSLMVGMLERGNQVCLAAPLKAPLCEKAREAGVTVYDFSQRNEFSLFALRRLTGILRKHEFDLVHFNTPKAIIAGGTAAQIIGGITVIASRRVNFPLRSRISSLKYNWLVDRVLTVSSSIKDTLIDAGVNPGRVKVVYEGVDLKWIDSQKTDPVSLDSNDVVIGTVAHLSLEKGHNSFLKAIALLVKEFPNARFLVVGDGVLRTDLEDLAGQLGIERYVLFTGFRTDSEALMKQFDIFCLPSLSEGLSSAIMAAMANRLPVVSTTVGGIPELVSDQVTGFLVTPDSPEELANALSKLMRSSQLRYEMGDAGRRRVEDYFTVTNKIDRTELSYLELLQKKRIR